ncbi:NAD(P)-dependent dehydrogenase (short-subunit alcohol dehydrogenase family) [Paenibacillus endophyticus]|uniref:NAD(P)-dependent dehydrogenase (Short-subunit alcohol dehydrogenase family) n=1 Tax=Paenibacillus endophyticus TaxID=1294268 RepID=A0A7W5CDW7_9BACL|nr:SDR family oxidoreductase [Paenibacillus endophyticus]MBB3155445.1 NAD(P)-dependent dehydrogenase (short-subunit alcohol dehydrogenase family) [Paenibacillus endophyticus]
MGILDNKIVLITGTGGGLGRVAALAFAREGAKVVGCDINADANNETVELVRRSGAEMTGIAPIDLTDPEQVQKMVEDAVSAYGGLDVVYNNAAIQYFGPMPDFSIEDWRRTITGELDIPFFVSKFTWPHLVERGGGVIINVASMAGMIAGETPPMVGHSAAKAGVIAMTRQFALEGARHGIRAVAISPGPFLTPASDRDLGDNQAARDAITKKTLLKRFGQPEELVELAVFIASDRASYITGANYVVDGGATAW